MSRTPRTALIGSERGMEQRLYEGLRNRSRARLVSLAQMPADITALIQLVSLILAAFALVMGAYLLIIGRRPWRGEQDEGVAPRLRLLGLSYILVFGSPGADIAVSATNRGRVPRGQRRQMASAASSPSISGISTSMSTASYASRATAATASRPFVTTST